MEIEIKPNCSQDGGYVSRKFWMTIISMGLVCTVSIVTGFHLLMAAAPNVPVAVGGILGCLGIYCGANVMTKHVTKGVTPPSAQEAVPESVERPNQPVE